MKNNDDFINTLEISEGMLAAIVPAIEALSVLSRGLVSQRDSREKREAVNQIHACIAPVNAKLDCILKNVAELEADLNRDHPAGEFVHRAKLRHIKESTLVVKHRAREVIKSLTPAIKSN